MYKCSGCGAKFYDYGDDHWLECPYCHSQNFTTVDEEDR